MVIEPVVVVINLIGCPMGVRCCLYKSKAGIRRSRVNRCNEIAQFRFIIPKSRREHSALAKQFGVQHSGIESEESCYISTHNGAKGFVR